MTTKLDGKETYLPFNRGSKGGAGNPENPAGFRTSYLWDEVLTRDSLLDIVGRFLHLQVSEKKVGGKTYKRETLIFPRYHQLDCVRRLVADSRAVGAGTNYLVQHSAGAGSRTPSRGWRTGSQASMAKTTPGFSTPSSS